MKQGLKPGYLFCITCGTTKVVPCYKTWLKPNFLEAKWSFSAACKAVPWLQSLFKTVLLESAGHFGLPSGGLCLCSSVYPGLSRWAILLSPLRGGSTESAPFSKRRGSWFPTHSAKGAEWMGHPKFEMRPLWYDRSRGLQSIWVRGIPGAQWRGTGGTHYFGCSYCTWAIWHYFYISDAAVYDFCDEKPSAFHVGRVGSVWRNAGRLRRWVLIFLLFEFCSWSSVAGVHSLHVHNAD
jgi:hypothetical protein